MGNLRQVNCCAIIWVIVTVTLLGSSLVKGQGGSQLNYAFDPFATDQWFKQKLDHYDDLNVENWPQRYLTSYRFYRLGGPVFLFLSGPGPELALRDLESGAIARYAEEQGAFVIGLEHRYYGKSKPTQDLSTENLRYLTVPQTLEDIATFIRAWKARDDFRDSKWVVFGASYLGSVTAWFAQKHPELIDAFVASSAPLELRYEIPEFLENVGFILNRTDPKCYETVSTGFKCLADIFSEQGCGGYTLQDVKTKFDFCSDLDPSRSLDATGAIAELFSTINGVVMYHDPSPDSFPDTNLERFCRHVSSESGGKSALDKIAEKVREINKHRGNGCAEFRLEETVAFLKDKSWDSNAAKEGYRQLQWQLCNELGWTVAAANISQPFGNYLNPFLHTEICQKLFKLSETEMRLKVLKANTDLRGKNLTTKCGIFVNGDMDPWHTFGITTPLEAGQCNRAIVIEGGSHSRDVEDFTNKPSHPPTVRETQIMIAGYLDSWLRTGRCCDDDDGYPPRLVRAPDPKDYFSAVNKTPNVQIRHRAYPYEDENERMIAAPTSSPYHPYSATDVLSVSPRIPVAAEEDHPAMKSLDEIDGDMYRDPRNAELRRYRVVKMLRHRPSIHPVTEPREVPSIEQFEANFPEYSIRVEGRVEKVFKNGSRFVESTQIPTPVLDEKLNEQVEMFNRGRKILTQTGRPNMAAGPNPTPRYDEMMGKGGDEDDKNDDPRFRYVVKHVFKDVVEEKKVNGSKQSDDDVGGGGGKTSWGTPSNKTPSKTQQELEETDLEKAKKRGRILTGDNDDDSSASGSSESSSSSEEENSSNKSKRESGEDPDDDDDDDSQSTSESVEHPAIDPRKETTASSRKAPPKKKVDSKGKGRSLDLDDDDDSDEDYDDEDYDDDDDDDSNEIKRKSTTGKKPAYAHTSNSSSTEFTSGEDSRPKRLREKISEKIRSSSEDLAGDQKSKEKSSKGSGGLKGRKKQHDPEEDDSSSDEEENYSLEPSGSDPQHTYRKSNKKQLAPLEAKPVKIDEGRTVINVEISGSYPKRRQNRRRSTTTTVKPGRDDDDDSSSSSSSSSEEILPSTSSTTTEKPKPMRRKVRRRKHKTTTTTSTTTEATSTTLAPVEEERENSYVAWNRDRKLNRPGNPVVEARPVQQEPPEVVNLEGPNKNVETVVFQSDNDAGVGEATEAPSAPNDNNNDAIYIVIGDIPKELANGAEENVVDDKPSGDALFRFIQKLVNRHRPGLMPPPPSQEENSESVPESPPPPPPNFPRMPPPPPPPSRPFSAPPTSPPQPASPPTMMNYGFDGPTGKYLLVRPVQVVALGREHVVHPHDLKNDTLLDLMTMETPTHPSPYAYQQYRWNSPYYTQSKRQYGGDYNFKSPGHRNHFERLLSVDGQVRDSDREDPQGGRGYYRQSYSSRRLDQVPDPTWRSIRGINQFGPVAPPMASSGGNPTSGLLSLSTADTQWVNQGVPFLPRHGRH